MKFEENKIIIISKLIKIETSPLMRFEAQVTNILMVVPLLNFRTTKLQLTKNVTKGHIFVAKNESIQYLAAFPTTMA